MKHKIVLHLTGGLGNQLFQYSAAATRGKQVIEINTTLGRPRSFNGNAPDIFSFTLPFETTVSKTVVRTPFLVSKATGYALRSGVAPRYVEKIPAVSKLIEFAVSIILFAATTRIYRPIRGKGVGYSVLKKSILSEYLIGYFQSYKYPQSVYPNLMKMEPKENGPELESLKNISKLEKPLVVHFRLGDYLQEKDFGIPGSKYYSYAISKLWNSGRYGSIWVFSDDINGAKGSFPKAYLEHVRWIGEVDSSPVATLQAMRLGSGYVIANSSFSWWGAFLSFEKDSEVIAPEPWFRGMESPKDLYPPRWERHDSDF